MHAHYRILLQALTCRFATRLKTVVLFGSRARNEAAPESDHDGFIVVEDLPADPLSRVRETRGAMAPHLADLPGVINLNSKTPAEFQADLTPPFLDVVVDGICLFGKEYFEPLRQKGLAALASSGMERKRIGRSLFWMLRGNGTREDRDNSDFPRKARSTWARLIRKIFAADPLPCTCGARMRIISI